MGYLFRVLCFFRKHHHRLDHWYWSCRRYLDLRGKVGEELGVPDHGGIVWDEFIAFWMVLFIVMPTSFWGQFWAFLLFRFFDAIKPGPIKGIDLYFKNWQPLVERVDQPRMIPTWAIRGFGVMIDDIAAAIFTLIVIAIGMRLW